MKKETLIQVFDLPIPDTAQVEKRFIADAMATDHSLGEIIPYIHPDFFTSEDRRKWWAAIVKEYNAGNSVKIASMGNILGPDFFKEIYPCQSNEAGTATVLMRDAELLRAGAAKRRAYLATATFLQSVMMPQVGEQDILTGLQALTRSIEGPAPLVSEQKIVDVLKEVRSNAKKTETAKVEGKSLRIPTGFYYLNSYLYGGFKAGQLIVLAARPSVGKTAVMLQMAKAAAKEGAAAHIFSLEMTSPELGERMLFSTGEVRPYALAHGEVEWQAFDRAEGMLAPLPIYINDFSRSLDEIVSRMTQAVKQGRCKIAFIDYLGLISDALNFGSAKLYQVIGKVTGTLKAVAKRLEIPIVLLCQMNREQAREKDQNGRPRAPELYDLRDSGSIEQDADIVIMLEPRPDKGCITAWLRKNRGGKKELSVDLIPNDTYSSFQEAEPEQASEPAPGFRIESDDLPQ